MSRKPQREPRRELARRTFKMPRKACHKENRARTLLGVPSKMSRKACHKENRARNLLGGPSKCPGKLATDRTVPGPCQKDLQNVPERLPQRGPCQELARRTYKMSRKACHKENRARTLLGGKACHKENRARTLLGGPSKCPGKPATKRTVPGICQEDLQNDPESLPQKEPCQDLAGRTFKMSPKICRKKNRARTLLGGPSKCPGKLATKRTVPGIC